MLSKEDIIYIAGFLDGEGWIGLQKTPIKRSRWAYTYYLVRIGVSNTNKEILEWLQSSTGKGYIRVNASNLKLPNRKPCWMWDISGKNAIEFLELIYPYLKIKKEVVTTIMELRKVIDTQKEERLSQKIKYKPPISEESNKRREELYQKVRGLNRKGLRVPEKELRGIC